MKRLFIITSCCAFFLAAAHAFQVVGTYPAPGSEIFNATDTLQIVFDAPPDPVPNHAIIIQGTYATYSVGSIDIIGNTLQILPTPFWLVGDKVAVIMTPDLTSFGTPVSPYSFQFAVKVPAGSLHSWTVPLELDYDSYEDCGTVKAFAASDFNGDGPIDLAIVYDKASGEPSTIGVAQNTVYTGEAQNAGGYVFIPTHFSWSDDQLPPSDLSGVRQIRAGDVNRDGLSDLVVSGYWDETLTIYRNMSTSTAINFGASPEAVIELGNLYGVNLLQDFCLGDFNSDGLLDIAAIFQGTEDLIVLRNHGDFAFSPDLHLTGIGSGPSMITAADFDLDGWIDLAVCYQGEPKADVFWNQTGSTGASISLNRQTITSSLPYGADGIAVGNVYGYWDPAEPQYEDIVIWSRGGTQDSARQGAVTRQHSTPATDDVGYLLRIRNLGSRSFGIVEDGPSFSYVPCDVILTDLDSTSMPDQPDRNWVVSTWNPGGNPGVAGIYLFGDDLLQPYQTAVTANIDLPAGLSSFDCDLDGDMDLFVIERAPGNEKILYYINPATPSSGFPVDTLDFSARFAGSPSNPSGLIPMDTTVIDTFRITNSSIYPLLITQLSIPVNPSTVFASLFNPPTYPIRIEPGNTIDMPFSFTPKSNIPYSGTALIQFIGFGQVGIRTWILLLRGSGGRSIIHALADTVDFGYVLPGMSVTAFWGLSNDGNYVLDARLLADSLGYMTYDGDLIDSLMPGDMPYYAIHLEVPEVSNDTTLTGKMMAYDGRFWNDDPLGYPLHLATSDTVRVTLQANVLRENWSPIFAFPRISVVEDSTYLDTIAVYDPNDGGDLQPIWYDTTGVSSINPALRVLAMLPHPGSYCDNRIIVSYSTDVFHGVSPETVSFGFRARDNQFPDLIIDTTWVITVLPVDDGPTLQFVSGDTTCQEWQTIDFDVAAYDEEFDPLDWGVDWTGASSATVSLGTPDPSQAMKFHFNWTPSQFDAGDYLFRLWVQEVSNPTMRDTIAVPVHVDDVPPDLRALILTASKTSIQRNEVVSLNFWVSEDGNATASNPFRVTLYDNFYGDRVRAVWSHTYPSLAIGGQTDCDGDSVRWSTSDPGKHVLELYVDPMTNSDGNLANNSRSLKIDVLYIPFHAHPLPFTPNNDTYNDTLYFDFGDDQFSFPKVTIFTVDGRLVTSLDRVADNAIIWTGRDHGGRECIPGAYLYVLQDARIKITSGLIYLAR